MTDGNVRNRIPQENASEGLNLKLFSDNRHKTNQVKDAIGCQISNEDIAKNMIKSEGKCNSHIKQYILGGFIGALVVFIPMTYIIFHPSEKLVLLYNFIQDNFITSTSISIKK